MGQVDFPPGGEGEPFRAGGGPCFFLPRHLVLVKKGGYYGISIVYSSGGSLTLFPGGEGAECLVMPVNPANPLEAVTFEKTF